MSQFAEANNFIQTDLRFKIVASATVLA